MRDLHSDVVIFAALGDLYSSSLGLLCREPFGWLLLSPWYVDLRFELYFDRHALYLFRRQTCETSIFLLPVQLGKTCI